jgi:hypothetical protein
MSLILVIYLLDFNNSGSNIGSVKLKIPWSRLAQDPFEIVVKDVNIILVPKEGFSYFHWQVIVECGTSLQN